MELMMTGKNASPKVGLNNLGKGFHSMLKDESPEDEAVTALVQGKVTPTIKEAFSKIAGRRNESNTVRLLVESVVSGDIDIVALKEKQLRK